MRRQSTQLEAKLKLVIKNFAAPRASRPCPVHALLDSVPAARHVRPSKAVPNEQMALRLCEARRESAQNRPCTQRRRQLPFRTALHRKRLGADQYAAATASSRGGLGPTARLVAVNWPINGTRVVPTAPGYAMRVRPWPDCHGARGVGVDAPCFVRLSGQRYTP